MAAVALPQYQKAVEKARATEALTVLKTTAQAAQNYYLAHGVYPNKFNLLDIEPPSWEGTEQGYTNNIKDTRSNEDWSLQISSLTEQWYLITLTRLSGPYKGAAWEYKFYDSLRPSSTVGEIKCLERNTFGFVFEKAPGDYCSKIFHGVYEGASSAREYLVVF